MKIISDFDMEDGALIECSCGMQFFIFGIENEKQCSCGKTYVIEIEIKEAQK